MEYKKVDEVKDEDFRLGTVRPKVEDEMTPLERLIKHQDPDVRIEDEHTSYFYKMSRRQMNTLIACSVVLFLVSITLSVIALVIALQ